MEESVVSVERSPRMSSIAELGSNKILMSSSLIFLIDILFVIIVFVDTIGVKGGAAETSALYLS